MSEPTAITLAAVDGEGTGVEVEFVERAKRIHHTIRQLVAGQVGTVWHCRGEDDCTLALQAMHQQPAPDGGTMLLLSGAGAGAHWSMSVHRAGPHSLCFDVAARVTQPPTDRVLQYATAATDDGRQLGWKTLAGRLEQHADEVTLHTANAGDPPPVTLRWKYTVSAPVGD